MFIDRICRELEIDDSTFVKKVVHLFGVFQANSSSVWRVLSKYFICVACFKQIVH